MNDHQRKSKVQGTTARNLGWLRILLLAFLAPVWAWAQSGQHQNLIEEIRPKEISVCESKTTHILFAQPVKSVDIGHASLLAQISDGQSSILSVKAKEPGMKTTTLTVITAEGGFYSFLVSYDSNPSTLNWIMPQSPLHDIRLFRKESRSLEAIKVDIDRLLEPGPSSFLLRHGKGLVDLQVRGIYVHQQAYYIKGWIRNRSYRSLRFKPMQFMVQPKKRPRKGIRPGREVLALIPDLNPHRGMSPGETLWWVAPLPELAIAPKEVLVIRLEEDGGHRILRIRISSGRWARALPLERSGY